jgi:hypothetical protein
MRSDSIYWPASELDRAAMPNMRKQCRKVTRFRLRGPAHKADTWAIVDCDTFNNWRQGRGRHHAIDGFASRDAAVLGAWRAWAFKTGQRSTLSI